MPIKEAKTEENTAAAVDPVAVIEKWFQDTFYNKALETEYFNHIMDAKNDLIARFKQ